jgi:hypothetical protein
VSNQPDGRYDRTKPYEGLPNYGMNRPFASNEERLTSRALEAATVPGAELQEMVRPPLPQVQLFPPRFGYRTRELSISDIISDIDAVTFPAQNYSGGPNDYSGTSRNSQGTGMW